MPLVRHDVKGEKGRSCEHVNEIKMTRRAGHTHDKEFDQDLRASCRLSGRISGGSKWNSASVCENVPCTTLEVDSMWRAAAAIISDDVSWAQRTTGP